MQPILINGEWRAANASGSFQAENPATMERLPEQYPISAWADIDAALTAAAQAYLELRRLPPERLARFLETYADALEANADALCALANLESGLPVKPRLCEVELPRTVNQLKQSAAAARDGSWALPTIDTATKIRSCLGPIGPVWVFGPNNFPFAYNGVAGGDFAAAIATGNPVIGKANTCHPGTAKMLAEMANGAAQATGMPRGTVQLLYRTSHADGERLAGDPRTAAIGYTGGRSAGLSLKRAADAAGKPMYCELSSVNPVVILPGALAERGAAIIEEYVGSCTMGAGQFCTNPGLVVLPAGKAGDAFIAGVVAKFKSLTPGTLLTKKVQAGLVESAAVLRAAGAELLCGGTPGGGKGYSFANTLLKASGAGFLRQPEKLQTEAFGNAALFVVTADANETVAVLTALEGNLTGSIYSAKDGPDAVADQAAYELLEPILRDKVGRLLNDKMPTGVAVCAAMNHGGPYPATGHAGFTAVGVPAGLRRFAALHCYDNVRPERLPPLLRDANPTGKTWRLIDGAWTLNDLK